MNTKKAAKRNLDPIDLWLPEELVKDLSQPAPSREERIKLMKDLLIAGSTSTDSQLSNLAKEFTQWFHDVIEQGL